MRRALVQNDADDDQPEIKKIPRKNYQIGLDSSTIRFQLSMLHFDYFSQLTNISISSLDWPLISGPSFIFPEPLVAYYPPCENFNFKTFEKHHLLGVVSRMMFTYGDGPCSDPSAVRVVFQHTMSMLVAYCNYMWRLAREDGRNYIRTLDLMQLMSRDSYRFRRFVNFALDTDQQPVLSDFNRYISPLCRHVCRIFTHRPNFVNFFEDDVPPDPRLKSSVEIFEKSYTSWPARVQPFWRTTRRISFCSPRGRQSPYFAHRLHEAIGLPPLETDLIYHLDYVAREFIMELVKEGFMHHRKSDPNLHIDEAIVIEDQMEVVQLTVDDYRKACSTIGDPLFSLRFDTEPQEPKRQRRNTFSPPEPGPFYRKMYEKNTERLIGRQEQQQEPAGGNNRTFLSFDLSIFNKMRKR